jgi:hypothetical protein
MERVLAQAAQNGRRATVTAVEKALGIPHATFDRNYRHLIEDFRQRAQRQATARLARPVSTRNDPARSCSGFAGKTRTSDGSSRSTLSRYASSPWIKSNSKPSSTPPSALPRLLTAEEADHDNVDISPRSLTSPNS